MKYPFEIQEYLEQHVALSYSDLLEKFEGDASLLDKFLQYFANTTGCVLVWNNVPRRVVERYFESTSKTPEACVKDILLSTEDDIKELEETFERLGITKPVPKLDTSELRTWLDELSK